MSPLKIEFEFIFVDDGSRDRTPAILRNLQTADSRVRAVLFSRSFDHQIAVTSGIERASADAVVLIDADLQDPSASAWFWRELDNEAAAEARADSLLDC